MSPSTWKLSVKRFAACVRGHWGIENTLHWCLDVTFREDDNRVRDRILADNLAWLKRFAISLLKQVDDKESIAIEPSLDSTTGALRLQRRILNGEVSAATRQEAIQAGAHHRVSAPKAARSAPT